MRASAVVVFLLIAAGALTGGDPAAAATAEYDPFSQFRGPVAQGRELTGVLPDEEFGLSVAWSRELGSGYSHVSIAEGKAVTMFASGGSDVVAAFDAASGEELWRYELGETYAGHDGSDDGPLGTPAIVGDAVYALGPRGRLVALSMRDGSELWRLDLDEESSTRPYYGFASSPLPWGDLLIVATGGEGHSITALDRRSGEVRWTAGDDSVSYQTPIVLELGGETTLVAVTDRLIQGLDPATGEWRFELRHGDGGQNGASAHVTPIDGERFLVKFGDGARMYRRTESDLEELWRSRAFANSLAIPVLEGDHLYGFTGRFLTCAAVDDGEIVWRSRPPLALGLTPLDGKLAAVASTGELVLVDASPDGYREVTRVAALDRGDHAAPSFGDGLFLVRNLDRIAAVRIDPAALPRTAGTVDPADYVAGELGEWVSSVLDLPASERQTAVDERFAGLDRTPLFEGDGLVHFVYRGDAEDVGLEGDEFSQAADNRLFRVPATDLFVRSEELEPRGQFTYALTVDYGFPAPDPNNPHTVDNGFNVVSELRMPEWPPSPHLEPPAEDAPRGELDSFPFRSDILDNTRQIQVWRPAGYGSDPEARYPLLVVNHGDNVLRGGLMRNTLDNLVGTRVEPLIAVFVPRLSPAEYGGEQADDYVRFLAEELLPHLDRHYLTDGRRRAIMGPASAGVAAVYAAVTRPRLFQKAATQSFYPIEPARERLPELIAAADPKPEHVYVAWSRNDYDFDPERRADEASRGLLELLRAAGVEVTEQVADYSPNWGGWRGQDDDILVTLFPLEETP